MCQSRLKRLRWWSPASLFSLGSDCLYSLPPCQVPARSLGMSKLPGRCGLHQDLRELASTAQCHRMPELCCPPHRHGASWRPRSPCLRSCFISCQSVRFLAADLSADHLLASPWIHSVQGRREHPIILICVRSSFLRNLWSWICTLALDAAGAASQRIFYIDGVSRIEPGLSLRIRRAQCLWWLW